MRFPERSTAIGQMINSYLTSGIEMDDRAIHLLFSANRWEAKSQIEEALHNGEHIVCDRYAYSGIAFSAAKDGLDFAWCAGSDKGLPAPDAVVYLDISVDQAMLRGAFGEERYEKESFQRKVAANFALLMATPGSTPWHTVDAMKTTDEIHEEIKVIAAATIEKAKESPIGYLD
jgi:dTMP kinase